MLMSLGGLFAHNPLTGYPSRLIRSPPAAARAPYARELRNPDVGQLWAHGVADELATAILDG